MADTLKKLLIRKDNLLNIRPKQRSAMELKRAREACDEAILLVKKEIAFSTNEIQKTENELREKGEYINLDDADQLEKRAKKKSTELLSLADEAISEFLSFVPKKTIEERLESILPPKALKQVMEIKESEHENAIQNQEPASETSLQHLPNATSSQEDSKRIGYKGERINTAAPILSYHKQISSRQIEWFDCGLVIPEDQSMGPNNASHDEGDLKFTCALIMSRRAKLSGVPFVLTGVPNSAIRDRPAWKNLSESTSEELGPADRERMTLERRTLKTFEKGVTRKSRDLKKTIWALAKAGHPPRDGAENSNITFSTTPDYTQEEIEEREFWESEFLKGFGLLRNDVNQNFRRHDVDGPAT
eukprot:CAMPEP_0114494954 /NCGR_PEP_ID=MMETSP0109-20121206/4939_1 /TAXON_ID=29199 /ORGANISM="Chlorarachnion reptans, Strain CCCM449" /LENGTH=359 /DNA_ID=CAMNT_0001672049 /DNA_START=149 /DNA_END=1226 /DNA_ORIENTATION=+